MSDEAVVRALGFGVPVTWLYLPLFLRIVMDHGVPAAALQSLWYVGWSAVCCWPALVEYW